MASMQRTDFQLRQNTRDSERVDDLFLINTSHQRECSTSPTRELDNQIRSPVNGSEKYQGGGYNISELYDSEVKHSINGRLSHKNKSGTQHQQ